MQNQTLQQLDYLTYETYKSLLNKEIIPKIFVIYNFIVREVGYGNRIWFGDRDVYVHIEKCKNKDILVIDNAVTCFDNNVLVFVIEDDIYSDDEDAERISLCQTVSCSEEMTEYSNQYKFGDHRDYKHISIKTLRENNFMFGYQDNRDDFHVFSPSPLSRDGEDYNNYKRFQYGCGFIHQNLRYMIQEVEWAYETVVKDKCFTKE